MQSNVGLPSCVERLGDGRRPRRSRHPRPRAAARCSRAARRRPRRPARAARRWEAASPARSSASTSSSRLTGFTVAGGAHRERGLRVVADRDHVHRDVPRARVALEPIEHRQARVIGQAPCRAGPRSARSSTRQRTPSSARVRDQHSKSSSRARSRRISANAGSSSIDQQQRARRAVGLRSSGDGGRRGHRRPAAHRRAARRATAAAARAGTRSAWCARRVAARQRQRERAAPPGSLSTRARRPSRRARSREIDRPEPGAAELAVGRAVGLPERLEDDLVLLLARCRCRCRAPRTRPGSPARAIAQRDLAALGELERVREQVLEDLLHALLVGARASRALGSSATVEAQPLLARDRLERRVDRLVDAAATARAARRGRRACRPRSSTGRGCR